MQTPVTTCTTNEVPDSEHPCKHPRLAKPWKISDKGIAFLAEWESGRLNGITRILRGKTHDDVEVTNGMILVVYLDTKGLPTVGCGHRVVPADKLKVGDTITMEQANQFLKSDLHDAEKAINTKVKVPLYQYEYDALVCIVVNSGAYAPATSLANKVNTTHYEKLPEKLRTFWTDNGNSNVGRRSSEANLFKTGVYNASH